MLALKKGVTVFNHGVAGDTTTSVLARLNAAIAASPATHVVVITGTNDVISGNLDKAIINIRQMVVQIQEAGKIALVGTLPPLSGSRFSDHEADIQTINSEIIKLRTELPSLRVVHIHEALKPNWNKYTSGDFIHLGLHGNKIIADLLSQAI